MAYGHYLEAEYESGYVHREQPEDHSPYVRGQNIFNDIINNRPVEIHGRMTRFTLVAPNNRYDIDWTTLPDNARPIYLRYMENERNVAGGESDVRVTKQDFGYQYNDEDGRNHKEIKEII